MSWAKKRWEDPEYRNKMTEEVIGKKQSPETIAKRISKIKDKPRAPRTIKNCAFCGKELVLVEWEKNRKFCSSVCKGKWQSENAVGDKGHIGKVEMLLKNVRNVVKNSLLKNTEMKKQDFVHGPVKGSGCQKTLSERIILPLENRIHPIPTNGKRQ